MQNLKVDDLLLWGLLVAASCGAAFLWWGTRGFPLSVRTFPCCLIALDILSAFRYLAEGGMREWRAVVYWLAAAALTFAVTK